MDSFELDWQAPEYVERQKHASWYWLSIIIAVLILSLSVWQKNFLFAVFVVLAEILVLTWGSRPPQTVSFKISEKGLVIAGNKFYPWNEFKSFSVEDEGEHASSWREIMLTFESHLKPSLVIRAPVEISQHVQKILRLRLAEEKWNPSFLDALERIFHF